MFTSISLQFILLVPISVLDLLINQTNLYNLIIPEELAFAISLLTVLKKHFLNTFQKQ